MKKLEKSFQKRYILFVSTIVIIIFVGLFFIQNSITIQKQNDLLIKQVVKQSILSKQITNLVFSFKDNSKEMIDSESIISLEKMLYEYKEYQDQFYTITKIKDTDSILNTILNTSEIHSNTIINACKSILNKHNLEHITEDLKVIAKTEPLYFISMQSAIKEYQNTSEQNLEKLSKIIYFFAIIVALILVSELLFVLIPAFKQLIKQNNELLRKNEELSKSENQIKENVLELTKLKSDLETKEKYNKIFIEQAPTSIAMLDCDMKYIAVSQQWIKDYKMEGKKIIGRSHYDLFPEIGSDWKKRHQKCLKGGIDTCNEFPFVRADGTIQWIFWDIRPWYVSDNNIGGLIMYSGDITHHKEKDLENIRSEEILNKTNEISRIGAWEIDLIKNELFWSRIVCEIHEVPYHYKPNLETAINFFKEGESKELLQKVVNEAIEHGTPYDIEIELITANNNVVWTRAIGQAEIIDGKCIRLFGVFQDINDIKTSQIALNNAHTQLKAIFNSENISIVTTDNNGIINRFNRGAEALTGYSKSEMVGKQKPHIYHTKEELEIFKNDIAKLYGKNPLDFNLESELAKQNAYDTREWTFIRQDGSSVPVQQTLAVIKDEKNKNIGFLELSTDVSERISVQNELLKKNQLLNFAEKISSIGNWQWDTVLDKMKWSNNLHNIFKIDVNTENLNFDSYFQCVHPEDKQLVIDYFKKANSEKKLDNFYHRVIATDGKMKTIHILGKVITDNLGNIIEMIGTCQDVTEQKMAEKKFRGLLESAPDAMVIVNETGNIQLINKQAEALFGYSPNELLNQPVNILIQEEFNSKDPKTKKMVKGKESIAYHKNGLEIPVQISFSPLQTEEGLLVSAAIRDITKQKIAKNELLRKNQLLNFAEEITMMGNWQWNITTNNVVWSANLYRIFGVEKNTALTFNTYFSFVHPDDVKKVKDHIDKSVQEKHFKNLLHRIKLNNGKVKTIQLIAEINTNNLGEIIEMIGTCQDVTEQKMEENKFRGLLESAPDAMVIVNEQRKIQLINKEAEKLFGYTQEELIEKPVELLIPKRFSKNLTYLKYPNLFNSKIKEMGILGVDNQEELFGVNKTGLEIPVQISLSPLHTEEGLLISAAIRDITAQKTAARKIIESKENLEILANKLTNQNTQLADFAHITSHNLRAPVSNLNALLNFYKIAKNEEEKNNLFEKFEKVINHLTLTLDTLVNALTIKKGTSLEVEEILFDDVLNKTKDIFMGEILKTGIVIKSDFSKVKKISYNKVYLESIFLNLVSNAIKYKNDNRIPELLIESEVENGKIILKFKDNGLGIDLKRHGHKLFGLNKVFHRHPEAKGVGLFMTKVQIEAMGGTISVVSNVDLGTTFNINFN